MSKGKRKVVRTSRKEVARLAVLHFNEAVFHKWSFIDKVKYCIRILTGNRVRLG